MGLNPSGVASCPQPLAIQHPATVDSTQSK